MTNTCLVEEKKQMIQNKTYAMSCTRWLWIKNRTATDFNTLYYTEQNNCTKSIHRQQNIFSHVQDQTIDLFVQKTKRQENYQCLNNPDSWKIQQILTAKVIGKISEPLKSVDKSKKNLFFSWYIIIFCTNLWFSTMVIKWSRKYKSDHDYSWSKFTTKSNYGCIKFQLKCLQYFFFHGQFR